MRRFLAGWTVVVLAGWAGAQDDEETREPERRVDREVHGEEVQEDRRELGEVVVTATRREELLFTLPFSGRSFDEREILSEKQARTVPEILQDTPSVLVQKTATGQGSPFLRGFTGYRNVFLIDGIRLNNSTFRSGPNQYWSTVDHLMLDRLELVFGPASVLYGSDAIGGAVNAIPSRPTDLESGFHLGGRAYARYASAEDSFIERVEVQGNQGSKIAFLGGLSMKSFGDLRAGRDSGELQNTAYDQFDADFRVDYRPYEGLEWTLAYQHTGQDDVPRTHRTIRAVPFHGTSAGSEIRRDLDQRRDLAYSRWTLTESGPFYDRATFTLSFQRQEQKRDRLRSGARRDLSGFDVNTWGAQAQFEKESRFGYWTFGADFYYDEVDSFRRNFVGGSLDSVDIQGPLGDEADYALFGVYVQDEFEAGGIDWIAGVRYTRAEADADRVDNPEVDGSDPTTPGNIISIDDSFDNVVGSIRGSTPLRRDELRLFFGASQGFRTPSLSDLTSFDATSVFEVPTEDLDPENFLSFELGLKTETKNFAGRIAGYYTFIDDLIVRSPTGEIIENTPVVEKDNVGDGHVAGIEVEASYRVTPDWTLFGALGWQSGQVDQFKLPSGQKVDKPLSRLMPLSGIAGARWEPAGGRYFVEAFTRFADDQDRLSLRDRTDTERIPPGGTPGYATLNVRSGVDVSNSLTVSAAVENITDKDYRIHGSGQNEPGTNFIVSVDYRF